MNYLKPKAVSFPKSTKLLVLGFLTFIITSCKQASPGETADLTEEEIVALAQQIHAEALILDAHADIVTPATSPLYVGADGTSKVTLPKLQKGGVDAVVMSVAVDPGGRSIEAEAEARKTANEELQIVLDLVSGSNGQIVLAKTSSEIINAEKSGKTAFILGFQNARALEKDLNAIDSFYNVGVRLFALTHLGNNDFADSSRPSFDGDSDKYEGAEHNGLSDLGKAAIRRINELGAIVDISQLTKEGAIQVIKLSSDPVIASHSNVRSISDVSRNLSDEEIDLIAENEGVIHLSPFRAYLKDYSDDKLVASIKAARGAAGVSEDYSYPFELYWEIDNMKDKMAFLTSISDLIGPAYVTGLVDHIDYIVQRVGIDHVGIGSDFNHGGGVSDYDEASDALNVTTELVRRGYSKEDIEKIWSGNFLRVMEEVER